jgi:hypothetical protein
MVSAESHMLRLATCVATAARISWRPHIEPAYSNLKPAYSNLKPAYSNLKPAYSNLKPAYSNLSG